MPVSGGRGLWTCIQFECLFQKIRSKGNAVHLFLLLSLLHHSLHSIYRICSDKNINHIITTATTTDTHTHTLIIFAFSTISQHYFLVWKLVLNWIETRDIFFCKKGRRNSKSEKWKKKMTHQKHPTNSAAWLQQIT